MRALQQLEGKRIFAIINSKEGRRRYSGRCIEVTDLGHSLSLVGIIDKFGKFVAFHSNEIEIIQEEFETYDDRKREQQRREGDDVKD